MTGDVEQRLHRLEDRLARLERAIEDTRREAERRARTGALLRLLLLAGLVLFYLLYFRSALAGLG